MNEEKDKLSFNEGEEEEFHITDEDIDRELASMEKDHIDSTVDDTISVEETLVPQKPAGRFSKLKQLKRKHWLMIILVLMVLIFGLVRWMSNNSAASFNEITPVTQVSTLASPVAKTPAQTDLTATLPSQAVPSVKPAASTQDLLPSPDIMGAGTKSALSATHSPNADLTAPAPHNDAKLMQALETIEQQNQMLRQQLTVLSTRVQGLETSFNESNQAVEGLSQQVVEMQKNPKPSSRVNKSVTPPPVPAVEGPQYSVEAVVPQRAWLQTTDGATITVMVGDEVPGLGTVAAIDPYSGNVTTSSGTVIKYAN